MAKDKIKSLEKKLKALRSKPNTGASARKKVDMLNDLAYALYTSDPKKTENYARQALSLAKNLGYAKGNAQSYHIIGISYVVRGNHNHGLKCFLTSLKIREDIGEKRGIANTYHCIGNIHLMQGDYDHALEHYLKSLKIYEKIRDKKGIAHSYNEIGVVYNALCNYKQALQYYLKSLKIYKETVFKKGVASSYTNIGNIYRRQGDYEQALKYCFKGYKVFEEIGDKEGMANAGDHVGGIHETQGEFEEALKYFLKALKIREKIGDKNGIVHSFNSIGHIHTQLKRYDSALSYLQKGLQLAQEIGAKNSEIEGHKNLSELFKVQRNYKQALSYYKKYTNLEKEIFNAEKSKQIAEMQAKYETEKKEREAEIYHLKNVKLRKEIKERKKVEEELKKHRDQLEEMVAERTAQLRSLAHELSLVEEKERRKIATYLHDDIGQALALATVKLELLQEMASTNDIRKELEETKEIIDQTTLRTRSLTFEISPPVLYDLGFEPAVEWLAGQFQKQHGIIYEFKSDGLPKPMSNDTKIILFQSVRELLINVSKHAQARNVMVSTMRDSNIIRIEVKDDGVGFDPKILDQKITKNEGFGLFNLRERLRYLHGKVEVSSIVGQGTSVAVMAPLKSSQWGMNKR